MILTNQGNKILLEKLFGKESSYFELRLFSNDIKPSINDTEDLYKELNVQGYEYKTIYPFDDFLNVKEKFELKEKCNVYGIFITDKSRLIFADRFKDIVKIGNSGGEIILKFNLNLKG